MTKNKNIGQKYFLLILNKKTYTTKTIGLYDSAAVTGGKALLT
jgi:hypothetical protein